MGLIELYKYSILITFYCYWYVEYNGGVKWGGGGKSEQHCIYLHTSLRSLLSHCF